MTLAHEVTAAGNAFPSLHIFVLKEPSFGGPQSSGQITVELDQTGSNVNALAVCYTGVNTAGAGYDSASFVSQVYDNITTVGTISGNLSTANVGDLLVDCVVAQAGIPDDHTPGTDQTLVDKVDLNTGGSAAMSISHRLAINLGNVGMIREDVTALKTVSSTAFVIYMN
jgi:hypothetical protein